MSDWQYNTPMGAGVPGNTVSTQLVGYRDILDARRSSAGAGSVPSAAFPDGYLGTITSRREDRLLKAVQNKLTDRSYQRGVHKGEKIDPRDYFWTDEVNPNKGLEYEARGLKWTQHGNPVERLAHMGKTEMTSPAELAWARQRYGVDAPMSAQIDPVRQQRLARLLPGWR